MGKKIDRLTICATILATPTPLLRELLKKLLKFVLWTNLGLMDFIMGHMLCLYVKVTPPKNSEFYLHFWPLAPHIGGAVGANGKTAQKWLKKYQISKLAENLSKSWKHLKPNAIPSFLRDVGLIKVVSKFSFGHPKCHFWARKDGHHCRKCPSLRAQKWHFGCPNKKLETTFISPTSPKNDGIAFGFKRFQLLNMFSANLEIWYFFQPFWSCFSISTDCLSNVWR